MATASERIRALEEKVSRLRADVDTIESELGRASEESTIRGRLHTLANAITRKQDIEAYHERRGASFRRWGTFMFAGIAALAAIRPWEW